jgi:dTDP-4-amino-4,6-dideoxygalactose transaminase
MSLIPIAGMPISLRTILAPERTASFLGVCLAEIFWFSSGIAAMADAFVALRESCPEKDEVLLPAYSAGSLVVAVRHAGMRPVFVDLEKGGWHPSVQAYRAAVTTKTACAVAVHLFGIPQPGIAELHHDLGVLLFEDACQAQGSSVNGIACGQFGDISVFSFNKGKNIPAMAGGAAIVNDDRMRALLSLRWERYRFEAAQGALDVSRRAKLLMLSLVTRPFWYGALQPLLAHGKDTRPPASIAVDSLSFFAIRYAAAASCVADSYATVRARNAALIADILSDACGVSVPGEHDGVLAAYNRLPLVIEDISRIERIESALRRAGFESSRMYVQPLHRMFPELGIEREAFPHATYQAEHLLCVPCHPLMREKDVCRMADCIRRTV